MKIIPIYNPIGVCYRFSDRTIRRSGPSFATPTQLDPFRPMKTLFALLLGLAVAAPVLADSLPVLKVSARDGVLEPAVIEAPAGKRFVIEVTNDGKAVMEFESHDLKVEKVIPPGHKASFNIRALKSGEYRFYDEFHEKTGQGKVIVK